jgi:hypothetical protein
VKKILKDQHNVEHETELERPEKEIPELTIVTKEFAPNFTGIARTMQCYLNNNTFNNFKILTLHIENGTVKSIDYSDPYANFEALVKMELANELSLMNLNNNWKNGNTFVK